MHHKRIINHRTISYSRTALFPYELRIQRAPREDWEKRVFENRYFSGGINRGNNSHSTVKHLISINPRSVLNYLKANGLFVYFPSARFSWYPPTKPERGPPFWWQKQTLNCLRFHWLVNFCCSSSIRKWLPPRSHISQCSNDMILLP